MIHEFAIEPELAATWHDRRVGYPVLCQMGPGHRRVPCAFPAAAWKKLVMAAFQALDLEADPAQTQRARKNIEILLRHLHEIGTRRNGTLLEGEKWLDAALREHAAFPFGGILVQTPTVAHPHLVVADQLAERDFPAWTPPAPPVVRRPRELAAALAPLLRSAAQLRFVDPHFDADVPAFYEPMKEYLLAAQQRRTVGELHIQMHLGVRTEEVQQESRLLGRRITEGELAEKKLASCKRVLRPLLQRGVTIRVFAWGESTTGIRMHNRYVLSEVGGIAVLTGLDRNVRPTPQTDDLTVLTKEQHAARWSEFSAEGRVYRRIAEIVVTGADTQA